MRRDNLDFAVLTKSYIKWLGYALLAFLFTGSCIALVHWAIRADVTSFLGGWAYPAGSTSRSAIGAFSTAIAVSCLILAANEARRSVRQERGK